MKIWSANDAEETNDGVFPDFSSRITINDIIFLLVRFAMGLEKSLKKVKMMLPDVHCY